MKYDFSWSEKDFTTFFTLVASTAFFASYWFIFSSEKIKAKFYSKFPYNDEGTIRHVLFTKYAGFMLMGVIPAIVFSILIPKFSLADYGLTFHPETNLTTLLWILCLGVLIVSMNYFAARRPKTVGMYPQIRAKYWDKLLIFKYSLSWCAYLFGYELLFRGFLFIPLVDALGVWPAIAINIALYMVSHIPKGIDETIGAGPLGLVLCLITLQTQTIWVAFVVHVFLALSNSLFALKFHPEFKVVADRNSVK